MTRYLFFLTVLPVCIGFFLLFLRSEIARRRLALLTLSLGLACSVLLFIKPAQPISIRLIGEYNLILRLNNLSRLILIFGNLFGFLVCLYSLDYAQLKDRRPYFFYLLSLIAFSNLVCLSADFILFIFSWGATLVLLYALLSLGSGSSAKKALSIVGMADFSLILGICLYIFATGSIIMPDNQAGKLVLNQPLCWLAFTFMLIGALAKAGCGPFHTWIPQAAEDSPIPVMAILPASLDKLLGIYLLARICVDFFVFNKVMAGVLMVLGSLTIIFAVMLALIQHDVRKLLSFHAVSQVGYMVLGFGTGTTLGVAAGLFHMVNNVIYKSGLFLTVGSVGEKRKTFELDRLGGLAAYMPVTFACGVCFALSISGVPPFNGFASKWMLYQGTLLGLFNSEGALLRFIYIFSLIAAMFGSALTLASFIKFIHAVFLGQESAQENKNTGEVSFNMRVSVVALSGLCLLLGVLPGFFLRHFIQPWLGQEILFIGVWNSALSAWLLAAGLLLGFVFWQSLKTKRLRVDNFFIGGEEPDFGANFPATQFYRTIEELSPVKRLYSFIQLEALDLYNLLTGSLRLLAYLLFILIDRFINLLTSLFGYLVLGLSWCLRKLHSGVLDLYLAWSLLGLLVIFFILMAR
jgi:formate hydrogenlyase subunit 3/multisubunit Na+/H+ antiporter MnhD subunit